MTGNAMSRPFPARRLTGLRMLAAGSALALLAGCNGTTLGPVDWDLRAGQSSTAEGARQATATRPVPDANGVLSYPGYQLAQARSGETVGAVASRLGVDPGALAQANALRPNDPLRGGDLLLLPQRVSATPQPVSGAYGGTGPVDIASVAGGALDRIDTAPLPTTVPGGGREPIRHVVRRGETGFGIARTYNVSAKSLAEWNNLDANMTIREGQTLIIPVATGPAPSLEPTPTAPGLGSPTPEPPSASKPLPDEKTTPAADKAKDTPPSPDMAQGRSSGAKLAMPVSGSIVRGYDKKSNQGIDIAAPAGTPVKAAEAGTVAAITKDTEQVQIMVIRHADNLLTVYAGIDGLKVKKGDAVSRGQVIGAVRAANPATLHFEVRKGVDSLDPVPFLK